MNFQCKGMPLGKTDAKLTSRSVSTAGHCHLQKSPASTLDRLAVTTPAFCPWMGLQDCNIVRPKVRQPRLVNLAFRRPNDAKLATQTSSKHFKAAFKDAQKDTSHQLAGGLMRTLTLPAILSVTKSISLRPMTALACSWPRPLRNAFTNMLSSLACFISMKHSRLRHSIGCPCWPRRGQEARS